MNRINNEKDINEICQVKKPAEKEDANVTKAKSKLNVTQDGGEEEEDLEKAPPAKEKPLPF